MKRSLPLDGLRAIAVLIVVFSHTSVASFMPGNFGVTIFFFLSGYLITSLLVTEYERTDRIDFHGFYLRRAIRIIPPMWIAIGLTLFANLIIPYTNNIDIRYLPADLLFLTNYASFSQWNSRIPIPLWSLDIEEHFYVFFPFLFASVFRRYGRTGVAWTCAILCLAVLAARFVHSGGPNSFEYIYHATHTRIDGILFGCILAVANNPMDSRRPAIGDGLLPFGAGLALIALTFLIQDSIFRETLRYSFRGIGLFLVFNYILRTNGYISQALSHRALRPIADWSYFLYLIHIPVLMFIGGLTGWPGWLTSFVGIGVSCALSALVRLWVELPLANWRKRSRSRSRISDQPTPKGLE